MRVHILVYQPSPSPPLSFSGFVCLTHIHTDTLSCKRMLSLPHEHLRFLLFLISLLSLSFSHCSFFFFSLSLSLSREFLRSLLCLLFFSFLSLCLSLTSLSSLSLSLSHFLANTCALFSFFFLSLYLTSLSSLSLSLSLPREQVLLRKPLRCLALSFLSLFFFFYNQPITKMRLFTMGYVYICMYIHKCIYMYTQIRIYIYMYVSLHRRV